MSPRWTCLYSNSKRCDFFQACEVEFHIVSQAEDMHFREALARRTKPETALTHSRCISLERMAWTMRPMHVQVTIKKHVFETGCSPRTRVLTRMLMVQMSKHMDVQSRRTLLWKRLFEQSCAFFPFYHESASRLWNMEEGGVLSVVCGVLSVKCKVWSVKSRVWSVEFRV